MNTATLERSKEKKEKKTVKPGSDTFLTFKVRKRKKLISGHNLASLYAFQGLNQGF